MKNIVTTIPKSKFKDWRTCERTVTLCDGETPRNNDGQPWFWTINTMNLPKDIEIGQSVCYMIFDGKIRGYFDLVDTDISENWRNRHDIGKPRVTKCIVMANWHPCPNLPMHGFQGWRYTELKP